MAALRNGKAGMHGKHCKCGRCSESIRCGETGSKCDMGFGTYYLCNGCKKEFDNFLRQGIYDKYDSNVSSSNWNAKSVGEFMSRKA